MSLHAVLTVRLAAACADAPEVVPSASDASPRTPPPASYTDASPYPAGPRLTITSHAEALLWETEHGSLLEESLITSEQIEVTCSAKTNPTSEFGVAQESVRVAASDGAHTVEATATKNGADRYSATLNLRELRNGVISLWCRASDLAPEPNESDAFVLTYLDLGPTIEIISPTQGETYSDSVPVLISVQQSPITAYDPFVTVDDVTMHFGANNVFIGNTYKVPGGYLIDLSWSFEKGGLGPPPLRETTITVSASMMRSSTPAVRTRSVTFFASED